MITFEATVICDGCRTKMVAGNPTQSAVQAMHSALMVASRQGWMVRTKWDSMLDKWPLTYCPDCYQKGRRHADLYGGTDQ